MSEACKLNQPLSDFWPHYEGDGRYVMPGDVATGTTFDNEGNDYQHVGKVNVIGFYFYEGGITSFVEIKDAKECCWECECVAIERGKDE